MKPKRKSPAAKQTLNLSELSRRHGVTRETLRAWRDAGLDLDDDAAIRKRIAESRSPAAVAGQAFDGGEPLALAKARRERALADKAEIEVSMRRGQLLELSLVEDCFAALGAGLSAALKKLPSEFADRLEGLSASKIQTATLAHLERIYAAIDEEIGVRFKNLKTR